MIRLLWFLLFLVSLGSASSFVINQGTLEYISDKSTLVKRDMQACQNGNMNICVKLGLMHFKGSATIEQSHTKAAELFTMACKKEHAKACYYLGSIYKRGAKGVLKDLRKAKAVYTMGCMHGHAQSCDQYNLIKDKVANSSSGIESNRYRYNTDNMWN